MTVKNLLWGSSHGIYRSWLVKKELAYDLNADIIDDPPYYVLKIKVEEWLKENKIDYRFDYSSSNCLGLGTMGDVMAFKLRWA